MSDDNEYGVCRLGDRAAMGRERTEDPENRAPQRDGGAHLGQLGKELGLE